MDLADPMTKLQLNDHRRDGFIHILAWFQAMAPDKEVPKSLDLAAALSSSQLLSNLMVWCATCTPALDALLDFYDADGKVNLESMGPLLAVLSVAAELYGLPHWPIVALHAHTLDKTVDRMLDNVCDRPTKLRVIEYHRKQRADASAHLVHALAGVQQRGVKAREYFQPIKAHEVELLRCVRDATAAGLRALLAETDGLAAAVQCKLRQLTAHCLGSPETVFDSEPLATKLTEQVADQMSVVASRLDAVESAVQGVEPRFKAIETTAAEAKSAAFGAEQIVDSLDRAVGALQKAAKSGGSGGSGRAMSKVLDRLADVEERVAVLEGKVAKHGKAASGGGVRKDEFACLARQVDMMDEVLVGTQRRLDDAAACAEALDDVVAAALKDHEARLAVVAAQAHATSQEAEAAVTGVQAKMERVEAQLAWAMAQINLHFCARWNEVHTAWHAMQNSAGSHVPLPTLKGSFDPGTTC